MYFSYTYLIHIGNKNKKLKTKIMGTGGTNPQTCPGKPWDPSQGVLRHRTRKSLQSRLGLCGQVPGIKVGDTVMALLPRGGLPQPGAHLDAGDTEDPEASCRVSADGHLGCFHVLAIINSAVIIKYATEMGSQLTDGEGV